MGGIIFSDKKNESKLSKVLKIKVPFNNKNTKNFIIYFPSCLIIIGPTCSKIGHGRWV